MTLPSLMWLTKVWPKGSRMVSFISLTSNLSPSFVTSHWRLTVDIGNIRSLTTSRVLPEVPVHPRPTGPIPIPIRPTTISPPTTPITNGAVEGLTITTIRSLQTLISLLTFCQSSEKMANFCQRNANVASTRDFVSCVPPKVTWSRTAQSLVPKQ